MIINLSEDEKRQAIVQNVHSNIFVEAGAGAGKTTLIVNRVLNQLKCGSVRADQLVVITFTNKAAEELYTRIEKKLREEVTNTKNTPEELSYLTEALHNVENMQISTIHSFCRGLIKEFAFELEVPLNMELLESDKAEAWKRKIFNQWFSERLSKKDIERLKQYIGDYYEQYLWKAFLHISDLDKKMKVVYNPNALDRDFAYYEKEADLRIKQFYKDVLSIAIRSINKQYADLDAVESDGYIVSDFWKLYPLDRNLDLIKKISVQLNKKDKPCLFKGKRGKNSSFQGSHAEIANDDCRNSFSGCKLLQAEYEETCYALIMMYARMARKYYWKTRGIQYITQDLILQLARDLVLNNSVARAKIAQKYKCIYVDEFQDVDPVQEELIMSIVREDSGELRSGAIFIVGDPKQSIYQFRGAEPEIYHRVKNAIATSKQTTDEVYELDNNYRSEEKIIDWVNDKFATMPNYRNMLYPANKLKSTINDEKVLSGVYFYDEDILISSSHNKMLPKYEQDATQLCDLIKELTSGKYKIEEEVIKVDDANNEMRERVVRSITYKDFLILCYETKGMYVYTEMMSKYHIPFQLAGKVNVIDSEVLKRFLWLFQYLACPGNKRYREAALQVVLREDINAENYEKGKRCLKQLYAATKGMNGYEYAGYLLEHIEYLLSWDKDITPEEVLSCQTKLQQMVEYLLENTSGNAMEMMDSIQQYRKMDIDRELHLKDTENVVRFMNVHKAKGLEGNVVILANRRENAEFRDSDVRYRKPNDGSLEYYGYVSTKYGQYTSYSMNSAVRRVAQEIDGAERKRLEYVTATRAKNVFILMNRLRETSAFYAMQLQEPSLMKLLSEQEEKDQAVNSVDENQDGDSDGQTSSAKKFQPNKRELTEDMTLTGHISCSPSGLEKAPADLAKKKHADVPQEDKDRPKGNIFGKVMHRCFELLISMWSAKQFAVGEIENSFGQIINLSLLEHTEDMQLAYKDEYDENVQKYRTFLQSVLSQFVNDSHMQELLVQADEIFTELPFSFFASPTEDADMIAAIRAHSSKDFDKGELWINGIADLVLKLKDGSIRIIDYKSDIQGGLTGEEFIQYCDLKYEGQLELYRYAMAKIFDVDVSQVSTELYTLYR